MEMYFKQAAEAFLSEGKKLQPFRPFPPASCREAYEALSPWLKQKVIAMGEDYLGYGYPAIRATDFMAFHRTGNRTDYEDIYFARRYALNSLTAAECVEHRGRFLDDIINGIFALCEESAWQLPPHNSYGRGVPQDILPDSARPVLDLFACETGALLACIHYLLGRQLEEISPYITKRIVYELERRIITPYLTEHFWWMGRGEEPMCNWTPWCTQNVLLAVFLSAAADEEACRAVLLKAAESCDYFLKDYGEDGCCDEGAHYYRHAGLCLDGAFTVLNQVAGGVFTALMQTQKMKNIASYIFHVHIKDNYYFNFADCSPIAGWAGVREFLFGKHTNQPELMQFAAEDFRTAREEMFADESHRLNLFYRLQAIFCYDEIMAYDAVGALMYQDIFYPSAGLFLSRNDTFSLAVKAGDNDDGHNHNDTGSITLYKNGRPVLADIGVESYTKKTFSSDRYDIWTMQSCYHNLPAINGADQRAGADYGALNVITSLSEKAGTSFISMELSGAYPLPDPKVSFVRKVVFDKKADLITLTDHTDSHDVMENFIICEPPRIAGNTIKVGEAELVFHGASLTEVEVLPITDKRLQEAWKHDLYRIRLKMNADTFRLTIR